MNPWDQIKKELESRLSSESFQNWVSRTSFAGMDGETLLVWVPDAETKAWMESEYTDQVHAIIREFRLGVRNVVFDPRGPSNNQPVRSGEMGEIDSGASQLNPKFTFDSFVVGACNQFAHAAARSVATNPSRSYNPLFLYGGVGMGKTHLMHAIGRALMDNYPSSNVEYAASAFGSLNIDASILVRGLRPDARQKLSSSAVCERPSSSHFSSKFVPAPLTYMRRDALIKC
jgi:chromosomal replication initiator protein